MYFPLITGRPKFLGLQKSPGSLLPMWAGLVWPLQVLCINDTGTSILTRLQLHCGDKPAAGACGVVVERGAVSVLGVFGVNDGGALVADGPLPRLQVHLGLVASPSAVLHRHHCLAERGGCWNRGAVNPVSVMFVGVVLDLGVTPRNKWMTTLQKHIETKH